MQTPRIVTECSVTDPSPAADKMPQDTMWDRLKTGSKAGFDKAWAAADKLGAPVNRLSNKLGSEAFWPTTLDKESVKAARILRSFCKDGFYDEKIEQSVDGPKRKQRVLKKIPVSVIRNAKGLAIFTTMRTGLWVSGAGGSGVLVARKEDGTWSPPSGILLHTAGLGFLVGVDIYDCVIVLNTNEAVSAFSKLRVTLGGEISAVAGPAGVGGTLDTEVNKRRAPVFTYLKSRGFYAGVQVDGTVIIERADENERFYGYRVAVADILAGKVRHPPYETRVLLETIKSAQGDADINDGLLPDGPSPADFEIDDGGLFGIPDREDPDPYGVLALEKQGLQIKEAGSNRRVSQDHFDFRPNPTSPIYSTFRKSFDGAAVIRRESRRHSAMSNFNRPPSYATSTASTQTDFEPPVSSPLASRFRFSETPEESSLRSSIDSGPRQSGEKERAATPIKLQDNDTATPEKRASQLISPTSPSEADDEADDHSDHEEPVVYGYQESVHRSPQVQVISKPRIVTVAKLVPPQLPPRNPGRSPSVASFPSPAPSPPIFAMTDHGTSSSRPPSISKSSLLTLNDGAGDPSALKDEVQASPQAASVPASPNKSASVSDQSFKSASSKDHVEESATSAPSPPTRPTSAHDDKVQPTLLPEHSESDKFETVDLQAEAPDAEHQASEQPDEKVAMHAAEHSTADDGPHLSLASIRPELGRGESETNDP